MSGISAEDFVGYWQSEGERYARNGDYEWMAGLLNAQRVLEIGCGVGFGTAALLRRGLAVLALDTLPECLAATAERVRDFSTAEFSLLRADLVTLNDADHAAIAAFAPDAVVCWLMGAPSDMTGATHSDAGQAVADYRERLQRLVAELAASLPTVKTLHYVDRTAIPWAAKDIGRDTLVRYHVSNTLIDLPFLVERRHALFRKLDGNTLDLAEIRRAHPMLKSVTPTLASLMAERKF